MGQNSYSRPTGNPYQPPRGGRPLKRNPDEWQPDGIADYLTTLIGFTVAGGIIGAIASTVIAGDHTATGALIGAVLWVLWIIGGRQ